MKRWFWERFLPMWAKNTVMKDLERAEERVRALEQENRVLRAYVNGMKWGLRRGMVLRAEGERIAAASRR